MSYKLLKETEFESDSVLKKSGRVSSDQLLRWEDGPGKMVSSRRQGQGKIVIQGASSKFSSRLPGECKSQKFKFSIAQALHYSGEDIDNETSADEVVVELKKPRLMEALPARGFGKCTPLISIYMW